MRPWAALAVTALVVASGAQAAPPAAAAGFEVVDAELTPAVPDLTTGLASVRVVVSLRSDTPLPEVIEVASGDWPSNVVARPLDDAPWARPGESAPPRMDWGTLTQVDGTPTEGRWAATTTVSPGWTGTWLLSGVRDPGDLPADDTTYVDVTGLGRTLQVGQVGTGPRWYVVNASEPVRVVTGSEMWSPRVRITDRASGAGIAASVPNRSYPLSPPTALPVGTVMRQASPDGYAVWPARRIDGCCIFEAVAYGSLRSRGFGFEGMACVAPVVKWQANGRFAVSGRTVSVAGNAWPAPAAFPAANDGVRLQQLVGRTWRTVASGHVRYNGRYDVTWQAPTAGPQVLRIWKPGGANGGGRQYGCGSSVGTVLASVTVTTR